MDIEGMPLALLVNPSSAGGKTLKLLPRVEQALDARRVEFRVQRTKGLEHGVEQALLAIEAGEVPVVMSGDGLIGAVGGAMAGSETPLGIIPGGRGNDLARVLGIPDDPEAAVETSSPATAAGSTSARPTASASSASSASASTPKPTGAPTRTTSCAATSSTPTRRCAPWRAGSRPASRSAIDEERIRLSGYSVSVANNSAFGGGMFIAPDAELDDGEFDIVAVGEVGKLRFVA